MKNKTTTTTVSYAPITDNQNTFQNKTGDIKMNKFKKTMFAVSAAVFMIISTNSYSYTEGEGISGRAWVVNQAKYKTNKVENGKKMTDSMENKENQARKPARSTNSYRFAKGEGIGGRAWVVNQAKYKTNKVENGKKMTGSMENKGNQI